MSFFGDIWNGVTSLFSGGANYVGQKGANKTNREIARETNRTNREIAEMTNVANAKQAAEQMAFQERMSNTAYQRGIEDMKKAGINPMLAANLGGASSPPGASIPAVTGSGAVTGAPMQNELGPAVNSAIDAMRLKNEMSIARETVKNLQETNKKISSDTALNKAMAVSVNADAHLKSNSAKVADVNAELLKLTIPGAKVESAIDQIIYGQFLRVLGRANPLTSMASSASSAVRNISGARGMSATFNNDKRAYSARTK